jgi:hypothetical protein
MCVTTLPPQNFPTRVCFQTNQGDGLPIALLDEEAMFLEFTSSLRSQQDLALRFGEMYCFATSI